MNLFGKDPGTLTHEESRYVLDDNWCTGLVALNTGTLAGLQLEHFHELAFLAGRRYNLQITVRVGKKQARGGRVLRLALAAGPGHRTGQAASSWSAPDQWPCRAVPTAFLHELVSERKTRTGRNPRSI
ncbi:MAG: hypothetical protein ABWY04_18655 [Arthrobacter sp.]